MKKSHEITFLCVLKRAPDFEEVEAANAQW